MSSEDKYDEEHHPGHKVRGPLVVGFGVQGCEFRLVGLLGSSSGVVQTRECCVSSSQRL